MTRRTPLLVLFSTLLAVASGAARAGESFDWEPAEAQRAGVIGWLRGVRDGTLGFLDSALDLQLAAFAEGALLSGRVLMLTSDLVGVVDDNPVTQHVFKASLSKSLAKTAYLFHVAGADAVLGSHGLETEWYLEEALTELNPLLDPQEEQRALPLDPMTFLGEGMIHARVHTARVPGTILGAALIGDGVIRPCANVVRITGMRSVADRLEARATELVRRAVP